LLSIMVFKLLLIAAVASSQGIPVLKFKDATSECAIEKHGAELTLTGGCTLGATLTNAPDVSSAISALEQKIHDPICNHYQHANSDMVRSGAHTHATYNFCKFNCVAGRFWNGNACSVCAAPSSCVAGQVMNTPVCDGSTTANRQCEACSNALPAGHVWTTGCTHIPGCGQDIFSSTNLGSVGTSTEILCGSNNAICGEFDSNGDWDWIAQGGSTADRFREEAYYTLNSAKPTLATEVIGRVFVDAHGSSSNNWWGSKNGEWEDDDFCSVHFKACSTANCAAEGGMKGGSWTQVSKHKDLHSTNNGWLYKADHDNHNGAFSESNENSFSSHENQQKFSMPANKNYVTMKVHCIIDQQHEEFKATKLVIENGMGC